MPRGLELLLEAERRGILPDDKKGLLAEARQRGLVPASQAGGIDPAKLRNLAATEKKIQAMEQAQNPEGSGLKRFATGIASSLDPRGLIQAVASPIDCR